MKKEAIISKEELSKVVDLARLDLSEKEKEEFPEQLNAILDFFQSLNQVDTFDVEKFDHYNLKENSLRNDVVVEVPDDEKEKERELFPDRDGDFLSVKSVL